MIKICPKCGSGKIQYNFDQYVCTNCLTRGFQHELAETPDPADRINAVDPKLEIAEAVVKLYLSLLAKEAGKPIGRAIVLAGLSGGKDSNLLARLIRAACLGAHRATLEELNTIQKESPSGSEREQPVH